MSPSRGASTDSGRSKRVRRERNVYSPSRNEAKHRRGLERLKNAEPVHPPKKRGRHFEEKHKLEPMTPPKTSANLPLDPDAQFKEICERLRKRTVRAIDLTEARIVEIDRGLPRLQVNFFQHGEFGEGELAEEHSHETEVLKRAAKIEGERSTTSRAMPKRPEPPHGKSHWDYVVEEMVNISAEIREHSRWKSQSCKRIARAVQRYFADSNWRQEKQRRELELQLRRQASVASRDVRHFWKQIEQIAKYVYNQEQEVEKKAVREKQLHELLGQTEKYSSMIAGDFQEMKKEELLALNETELQAENAREESSDSDGGGRRPEFRSSSRRVTLGSISDTSFADTESLRNSLSATDEPDDEEFVNVDEAVDDEETMAAEEAKAQERGEGDNAEELTTLAGEADVDIIELLKSQGIDPESYLRDHGNYMEEEVTVDGESSTAQRRASSPDGFGRDAVKSGSASPMAETRKPDTAIAESKGLAVSDDLVASGEQDAAKDEAGAQLPLMQMVQKASPGGSVDKRNIDEAPRKSMESGHRSKRDMAVITSATKDSATGPTLVKNTTVHEDRAEVQNRIEKESRKEETQTDVSTDLGPQHKEVSMEVSKDAKPTPTVAKDKSESKIGVHGERKEDTAMIEDITDAKETLAEEDCQETVVSSVPKITVKEQKSLPKELNMRLNDSEDESTEQENETAPPELPSARDVETLVSAPLKQECMKEFANLNEQEKERLTAVMAEQGVEPATYFDDSDESGSSTEAVNILNATPVAITSGDHEYDEAQAMKDDIGDDEATMETAEKEITAADVAMETSALQDEMDIPLEEILRRSGVDPALYNLAAMDNPEPEEEIITVEESGGRGRRRRRRRPRTTESDAGVEGSAVPMATEVELERRVGGSAVPMATEVELGRRVEGSSKAIQLKDGAGGEDKPKSFVEADPSSKIEGNATTAESDQEDPALPEKALSNPEAPQVGQNSKSEKVGLQPNPGEAGRLVSDKGRDVIEKGPSETLSIVSTAEKHELRELVKVVKTENAHDDQTASESGAVHASDCNAKSEQVVDVRPIPAPKEEEVSVPQENAETTKLPHAASVPAGESKEATANNEGDNQIEKFVAGLDVAPSSPAAFVPPSLLHGELRDYQSDGVRWLVTLYEKLLNGILADEMGLGKTIMTIALLAWLAERRGIWGPHLIIVPTSVMVNWEVEFKKWCPGLKILTYFGSLKERRRKRQGWSKKNSFHVCITSYKLVVQDAQSFKRKRWQYMILDEAQHIKNFQSQRWQTLLHFSTARRLLLSGTPLQNSVMELWSLMHFLMPHVFSSHSEFRDWFLNPINNAIEQESAKQNLLVVKRLHAVLRPFMLRRLKREVEKNLPPKVEHIIYCSLSKRQRLLYEDFMARGDTQETLNSGNFLGVMNVLMQLRKVCNHPDLFEGRPIVSPLHLEPLEYTIPAMIGNVLDEGPFSRVDKSLLGLELVDLELAGHVGSWLTDRLTDLCASDKLMASKEEISSDSHFFHGMVQEDYQIVSRVVHYRRRVTIREAELSRFRCSWRPLYGLSLRSAVTITSQLQEAKENFQKNRWDGFNNSILPLLPTLNTFANAALPITERFCTCITPALSSGSRLSYKGKQRAANIESRAFREVQAYSRPVENAFRSAFVRQRVALPDARLVQWDCGKLQALSKLLVTLKEGKHRCLIFTQMSKVLDILESFLNLHRHRYLRLDGSTKTEDRQKLTERFNTDDRIFCFILTTRAGGVGLNLTGADCVLFYDNDWNPQVDAQAQDRAHRIGQTRTVHIYRLVSEKTIEENILAKADQKRSLESIVIQQAGFNKDGFEKLNVMDILKPTEGPDGPVDGGINTEMGAALEVDEDVIAIQERALAIEDFGEEPTAKADTQANQTMSLADIEKSLTAIQRYALDTFRLFYNFTATNS
ncbi:hypothetical protein NDN08_002409 [Rhodosorus marinus]|uniref:Uncharacterized protein n=1 Tax=Rhodosorus marinus TaxID=101924 RepID=A0AAV8UZE4_9RHOD|nr:hypothetical protein NDN08_002409 [Rhodosorus marinus]